jgi:hypothetical protein
MFLSTAALFMSAAIAATPCENLTNFKLDNATITNAAVVPEGPLSAMG